MSRSAAEDAGLRSGIAELAIEIDSGARGRLLEYLDALYAWNASAGLTRIRRADAVRLHLLDSLAVLPSLGEIATLADLGTGAGLPGIPIALARPHLHVTLVESRRRKCSFLLEVVRSLGLSNCDVLEIDAARLPDSGRRFHAVVSRAFRPPDVFVELALPLIGVEGRIVLMGGPDLDARRVAELASSHALRVVETRELCLPAGDESRRVVLLASRPEPDCFT